MPFLRNEIAADPQAICPADWGLVDGNRVPKPAYWAFQIYPQRAISWTLDSFSATPKPGAVLLAWKTVTETGLLGFDLHRAESSGGQRTQLNGQPIPTQRTQSVEGGRYAFLDRTATGGETYFYFLEGVSNVSPTLVYGPVRATAGPEPMLVAANDSPTPLGSPTTLTATADATVEVLTYTWALGDGWLGMGATVSHTYTETGIYTAMVTASTPISELVATTTVVVDEVISGLVALNDGPTPLGEPTMLSATIQAGSNVTYSWAFDDGWLGVGALVSHTYTRTGIYTALVTAANSVGEHTTTTQVEIGPPPPRYLYLPLVARSRPLLLSRHSSHERR
jgi:hypothetical protein